tara:strand:- start:2506 stop:3501 length:996 start_codon:yes stop_codon:yes gene_type:complete
MSTSSPFETPGKRDPEDEQPGEGETGKGGLASGAAADDLDEDALEGAVLDDADLEASGLDEDDLEGDDDDDGDDEDDGDTDDPDVAETSTPKSKKVEVDDEPVAHPDTPVPTKAKMLAALQWAFEAEADIPPELLEQFADHALMLLKGNREQNLTKFLDPKELAAKVYLDSWRVTRLVPLMATRLLDLGSGGGFPGLPIAMAEPMCSMVLSEGSAKKSAFLTMCIEKLALRNVTAVHEKAEEFLTRERVNTVVVRAVSSVRENVRTLRKVRHAVKDVVMLKSHSWSREVRAAEREVERLGFKLDTVWEHELPGEMGQRAILVYRAPGGAGM